MKRDKNEKRCQCSTCTETPTQQSATTQDQLHAQGLALCHDVTLDIVTHRWVPAGHPQYTGAREGRLWVAQAQTQLTLFVDPQSLSLECEQERKEKDKMKEEREGKTGEKRRKEEKEKQKKKRERERENRKMKMKLKIHPNIQNKLITDYSFIFAPFFLDV